MIVVRYYAFCDGDGDLLEGLASEACELVLKEHSKHGGKLTKTAAADDAKRAGWAIVGERLYCTACKVRLEGGGDAR